MMTVATAPDIERRCCAGRFGSSWERRRRLRPRRWRSIAAAGARGVDWVGGGRPRRRRHRRWNSDAHHRSPNHHLHISGRDAAIVAVVVIVVVAASALALPPRVRRECPRVRRECRRLAARARRDATTDARFGPQG